MSTTRALTPQSVLDAAECSLHAHLKARHATDWRLDVGCEECGALWRTLGAARALAELVPPTDAVVPAPAAPRQRGAQ